MINRQRRRPVGGGAARSSGRGASGGAADSVRADARPAQRPGDAAGHRLGGQAGDRPGDGVRPRPDHDELEPDADPYAVARAICVRLLAARARTRSELATALRKRAVPDEVAAGVLDRFTELGFIDDEAFAQAWVQSRQSGRGLAGRALAHELRSRGVADDLVRDAVGAIDPEVELATARELVRRRLASMTGVAADARYRRLAGMLARKGYPGAVVTRAVREALAGEGSDSFDGE